MGETPYSNTFQRWVDIFRHNLSSVEFTDPEDVIVEPEDTAAMLNWPMGTVVGLTAHLKEA